MAFPHASYETYAALRDMDISHPDITPPDHGGSWRLGHMASWARWGTTTGDLTPITAHNRESFDQLEPLTTRVILFAINLGGKAIAKDLEDWRNFHTKGHSGDGTLKNSVAEAINRLSGESEVPALYMTDVFKLIPTRTAAGLEAQIKRDSAQGIDHVGRCAAILRDELKICMDGAGGQAPVLVAMGDKAFNWLTGDTNDERIADVVDEVLGDGARQRVQWMPHYTFGQGSNEERAAALHPVLKDIISGGQGVPAAS